MKSSGYHSVGAGDGEGPIEGRDLEARQAQEGVRGVLGSGSDPIFAHSACDPGPRPPL